MSYHSKLKPITYPDTVRILGEKDVQNDIIDASGKLAKAMSGMMEKFESIAKQMHTIDLRLHSSLKCKWETMRKDLAELLWQFRTNAGIISGRLKLFSTSVIPMAARNPDPRSGRSHYHNESLQVLQSYMTISAEHAALTRNLVEHMSRLSTLFISFNTEFTTVASRHAISGNKEMYDLSQRIFEFEGTAQHICRSSSELSSTDVAHILFTSSRLVASAGRSTSRSKISPKPIVLDGDLAQLGRAYEQLDRKRNEVAHAQYAAQLRQSRTDPLATAQNMLSSLLQEYILTTESALSMYLSIWSRLRADCSEVFHWIKLPPGHQNPPLAISTYRDSGSTVYATFIVALDAYAAAVDPSLYMLERMEGR